MKNKLDPVIQNSICADYLNKLNAYEISRKYKIGKWTVYNILFKNNIKIRTKGENRTYNLDEKVFDSLTEETAYWIGFLMGDGSITKSKGRYRISVELNSSDVGHLNKLKAYLKSEHPLRNRISKNTVKIEFNSEIIANRLSKFGIIQNKSSLNTGINFLEKDKDFWRGLIDADGSLGVYNNEPRLALCGTEKLMSQFADFVRSHITNYKGGVHKHNNIYRVTLGKSATKIIVKILYENCTIALDRKLKIANKIIELGY